MRIIVEENDLVQIVERFLKSEFGKDKEFEIFLEVDSGNENAIQANCVVRQPEDEG